MFEVLPLAAPVFAIVGLGWLFCWRRWIADRTVRGLNDFVFRLPLPALMFVSAASASVVGGDVPLAFFAGCLPVYALTILFGRRLFGLSLPEAGVFGLNAAFGNTVMMGTPLVLAVFGRQGLELLLGIIALHALILLPPAIVIAELKSSGGTDVVQALRNTVLSILRNPIVLAVLGGTLWSLFLPPLPLPVRKTLEMLGGAASPIALFCLGASLAQNTIVDRWSEPLVGVGMKLIVMPLLVWLMSQGVGLAPLPTAVAVVTAGLPTGANAAMFARRYAPNGGSSGAMVFLGTVLSVVTLALLIVATRPA